MRGVLLGCVMVWAVGCAGRALDEDSGEVRFYDSIATDVTARCVQCHADPPVSWTLALVRQDSREAGRNYNAIRPYAMAADGGAMLLYHHGGGAFLDDGALERWQTWIAEGAPR